MDIDRARQLLPGAYDGRFPFRKADIPVLIRLLDDRDSCNRGDALQALGRLRAHSAVPAMMVRLSDASWVVRCDAAEALAAVGDSRAVPALRRLLRTRNMHVRSYVAVALSDLGDRGSVPRFRRMLRSRSVRNRISASAALYTLTREAAHLAEVGRWIQDGPSYQVRYAALNDLEWVMLPSDRSRVRPWLQEALRTERESEGLRKDLRRVIRGL